MQFTLNKCKCEEIESSEQIKKLIHTFSKCTTNVNSTSNAHFYLFHFIIGQVHFNL
jgi:hypothetical protein